MDPQNRRILIADDLSNIHEDFRKILAAPTVSVADVPGLAAFAPQLVVDEPTLPSYELSFVSQGEEAIRAVAEAEAAGRPFALLFLDVRMPPGLDGVETAQRLLQQHPRLQIVLCTAYTDYSFAEISARFSTNAHFLILKKPFDPTEILQVARVMTTRWDLAERHDRLCAGLRALVPALRERALDDPGLASLLDQVDPAK